jgi:hypothetical protein
MKKINKLLSILWVCVLGVVGIAIYPAQKAAASTREDYVQAIASKWNTGKQVKVQVCGYNWLVVGINSDTTKSGIGGQNSYPQYYGNSSTVTSIASDLSTEKLQNNQVALLLDKSTIPNSYKGVFGPYAYYDHSALETRMNNFASSELAACLTDIVPRTIESRNNLMPDPRAENDFALGTAGVYNQPIWPLSVSEVFALTPEGRNYSFYSWWIRSAASSTNLSYLVALSGGLSTYQSNAAVYGDTGFLRPAMFFDFNSNVFDTLPDLNTVYTVSFNSNGGEATTEPDLTVTQGYAKTFSSYTGTKPGFTFKGWSTSPSAIIPDIADAATINSDDSNNLSFSDGVTVNLYAFWEPICLANEHLENNVCIANSSTPSPTPTFNPTPAPDPGDNGSSTAKTGLELSTIGLLFLSMLGVSIGGKRLNLHLRD